MQQLGRHERIAALLVLMLIFACVSPSRQAYAATITVTTFDDNLANNNDCSLREAIQAANTDSSIDACPAGNGADDIKLLAGTYILSIVGAGELANQTGDLNLTSDMTIQGIDANTTRIDASQIDRAISIHSGAVVRLFGIEIQHGASASNGGGLYNDHGVLTLDQVTVANNVAGGNGGGIYNDHGTLSLVGGLRDNTANGNGGGVDNNGGTLTIISSQINNNNIQGDGAAISNNATLTLNKVWIHDNTTFGGYGGNIYNQGTAIISLSSIHNGYAHKDGGNIYSGDTSGLSSLSIETSTIAQGLATVNGGGIFNDGALSLTNVTVATNGAVDGDGIYNVEATQALSLVNTTVVSNTNPPVGPGEGLFTGAAPLSLKNTLIAYNGSQGDCFGSMLSLGHNLEYNILPFGDSCSLTATGDITSSAPLLGPYQDNGGSSWSYALLPNSPALNAGSNVGCPATDQRGFARPHGPACDIGALEENTAPQAVADSYSTAEDTPLVLTSPGLLANDIDADNDVITTTLVTAPSHGALALIPNGAFSYIPNADYHGPDSFSYRINDGSLNSTNVPVDLTITSVNDPPMAMNDVAVAQMDAALSIPTALLLANDTDIEGDPLSISAVRGNSARGGHAALVGDNVIYTPPAHFSGADSLIYSLSDGNGGNTSGTINISVGMRLLYMPLARR
jgi:CSLREA domain-containing protein